ncbi:IS30 family transposase, partial [Arthrobacter sp. H14]
EMTAYEKVRLELGSPVYFCDPHSPWQRGTNENTNRLLRHWFEKYSDLSGYTAADLKKVQDILNRRPRQTLGLQTPADQLKELLQTAA